MLETDFDGLPDRMFDGDEDGTTSTWSVGKRRLPRSLLN